MCFSAAASLAAGTALSVTGAVTLTKTKGRREVLFAAVPLLFGVQQLAEGIVWLTLTRLTLPAINILATNIFALFAYIIWPIYIPLAVLLLETRPARRKLLYVAQAAGVVAGLYLLYAHLVNPVTSEIVYKSIYYNNSHFYGLALLSLYFLATIGSCLISSQKWVNVFGTLTFMGAIAAYWFYSITFVSVWCFFSAVLSLFIAWKILTRKKYD